MADSNAAQDRGLFGNKIEEETPHLHPPAGVAPHGNRHVGDVHHSVPPPTGFHVHFEDPKHQGEGEMKPHERGLMGKLPRSNSSSSSSSSDEEGGEKGEKKKKKKGGLKEKLPGHKNGGEEHGEDMKEGLMEKIKEKLSGDKKEEEVQGEKKEGLMEKVKENHQGQKKGEKHGEKEEKKGMMDKIKDKLPGHHKK